MTSLKKCQNMQTQRQIPTNPIHQKISIALVWNQLTGGQIDSPGWGGCLALASALCAGLMIGPYRRKPPAVNRDFGPGCIRATHFGKNDSPQFSSLRDLS
jgi:hypothetical protein